MTTLVTSDRLPTTPSAGARWAAYAAAAWALGFAAVNLYLQIVGIDDPQIQQNWVGCTAINLGVVGLKGLRRGSRARDRAAMEPGGAGVAAVHLHVGRGGHAAALHRRRVGLRRGERRAARLVAGQRHIPGAQPGLPGFFALPGVLFTVAARHHQRRTATSPMWAAVGLLGAPLVPGIVILAFTLAF